MAFYANTKAAKIAFFLSKYGPWGSAGTSIGTTSAACTALGTKVTAAQDAMAAQVTAQAAAKTAVDVADAAIAAMVTAGQDILKQIRTQAAISGDAVWSLADLPVPTPPGPVPSPGMPYKFAVGLRPDGSLEIKFKCDNPTGSVGTIYQVYRKIGDGPQQYLGGSGTKAFIDTSIPAGSTNVVYTFQAIRSTAVGVSNDLTVKFGVDESGAMTAQVVEKKSPKIAA